MPTKRKKIFRRFALIGSSKPFLLLFTFFLLCWIAYNFLFSTFRALHFELFMALNILLSGVVAFVAHAIIISQDSLIEDEIEALEDTQSSEQKMLEEIIRKNALRDPYSNTPRAFSEP